MNVSSKLVASAANYQQMEQMNRGHEQQSQGWSSISSGKAKSRKIANPAGQTASAN